MGRLGAAGRMEAEAADSAFERALGGLANCAQSAAAAQVEGIKNETGEGDAGTVEGRGRDGRRVAAPSEDLNAVPPGG